MIIAKDKMFQALESVDEVIYYEYDGWLRWTLAIHVAVKDEYVNQTMSVGLSLLPY